MQFLVILAVSVACVAAAPSGLLSYGVHAPLAYGVQEVHAPLTYVAPVQTRVHYESRPVVVGHQTEILKPALGAAHGVAIAAPAVEIVKSAPAVEVVETAPAIEVVESAPVFHHAPLTYVAPVQTKVHYESRPVVVGHQTEILKPALGASHAVAIASPSVDVVRAAAPLPLAAPVFHAAPAVVDLKAPVPAGDAPPMSELVQTEKVLAPVRAHSKITPEVTVQLPTKVNVEKVAVDVPVAAPYAHPVPVPVTRHHHVGVATHHHISAVPQAYVSHTY